MDITDILTVDRVISGVSASSKKRILQLIGETLAMDAMADHQTEIFDSLIARERLGSTGFGHGVAIPHGRVKSAERAVGVFIRLDEPIDYDAIDGKPVDLIFALVVPEASTEEHLQILSVLAEMFGNADFCAQLRDTSSAEKAYELITTWKKGQ